MPANPENGRQDPGRISLELTDFLFKPMGPLLVFAPHIPVIRLLMRYLVVGGTSTLIEIGLFYSFNVQLGLQVMASNVLAVSTVTLLGFLGQKRFTFQADGHLTAQAMLYLVQLTVNFLLSNALVFLFVEIMSLVAVYAKALQLCVCLIFNFSFSKFVVFRPRHQFVSTDKPKNTTL